MNFIKNPTVIIVLLGLIVGSGLYFYNSYSTNQKAKEAEKQAVETTVEPTITNLTNSDPNDFTSELKKELDLADAKAKAYNGNEALAGVELTIPGSLIPRSGNATYIYNQAGDPLNHFTITISQATQTYIRAIIPKEDYYSQLPPINLKSWKLSYIDALKIAEKNGGQDFRSSNDLAEVQMVLKNAEPKGWLYWVITYKTETGSFSAQVDAFSGRYIPQEELNAAKPATSETTTQTAF